MYNVHCMHDQIMQKKKVLFLENGWLQLVLGVRKYTFSRKLEGSFYTFPLQIKFRLGVALEQNAVSSKGLVFHKNKAVGQKRVKFGSETILCLGVFFPLKKANSYKGII